jgi:hypothetical protein
MVSTERLGVFLGILCIFAAALGGVILFGKLAGKGPGLWIAAGVYMWTPCAAAVLAGRMHGTRIQLPLQYSWRWSLICAACGVAVVFASLGATVLARNLDSTLRLGWGIPELQLSELPGPGGTPPAIRLVGVIVLAIAAGMTLNGVFAYGEECGWRGFLYEQTREWGFWRSSLMVGAVWGLWHAPIVAGGLYYPGRPIVGVCVYLVLCTLLGPMFARFRDAGAPVTAVAAMHGAVNASAGVGLLLFRSQGESLKVGLLGMPGVAALVAINVVVAFSR